MRYAILGDIHSNLEALNEVIRALKRETINEYLCIGDIVSYNADPYDCIKIIKSLCVKTVAGNHDYACVGKLSLDWFRDIAKEALVWTIAVLDDEEKNYLSSLELIYEFQDFTLVHGTLFEPEEFHYLTNLDYAFKTLQVLKTKICFLGHTHKPGVYIMDREDKVSYSRDEKLILEDGLHYIVNVGSVGQPRDGDTRACICIYDSQENSIQFRRVEYDSKNTREKILASGLPEKLAWRLLVGR
jgi:predicted phosphodiesterase